MPAGWTPVEEPTGWTKVEEQAPPPSAPQAPWWTRLFGAVTDAQARVGQTLAHPDVVRGQASVLPELAIGAGKGAASTVVHGGDLVRQLTGQRRIINDPNVRAWISPTTPVERVGFGAEQMAEVAVPAARIGTAAKAANVGRFGVAMREAGTAAGVTGLQTGGDPAAMLTAAGTTVLAEPLVALARGVPRVVRQAAAVAPEGGIVGRVASTMRTAQTVPAPTPALRPDLDAITRPATQAGADTSSREIAAALGNDVIGSNAGSHDSARMMLVKALKPRNSKVNFEASLDRAMPEINASKAQLGRPLESIDDFVEAVGLAKKRVRAQYDAVAGPKREIGSMVDLSPLADAVENRIPRKLQIEHPDDALKMMQAAQVYRQKFSLEDTEQLLLETNAELEGFYAQHAGAQRAALTANPTVMKLNAQAKALRDAIYTTLDANGQGAVPRELQRRYGSLMEVEQEAKRRAMVAKRQQPDSLSEQLSTAQAAGDYARGAYRLMRGDMSGAVDILAAKAQRNMASFLKEQQTTDALIRRAFSDYQRQPINVLKPSERAAVAGQ